MIELNYQRLLKILNKVDEEEGKYVLYFIQAHENRLRHKIRQLEAERQEYEQKKERAEKVVKAENHQTCEQKIERMKRAIREQVHLGAKIKGLMFNAENLLARMLRQEEKSLDPRAEKVLGELKSLLEKRLECSMW